MDRAIADSYFQLGEYPWAILYDERALRKKSRQSTLKIPSRKSSRETRAHLFAPANFPQSADLFFITPATFRIIFLVSSFTFSICSAAIWFPHYAIRKIAASSAILLLVFFITLLFSYYFIPLEGIIVRSTGFYRNPNLQAAQLTKEPLLAGSKVRILQTANGDWLKIADQQELIGYVPAANIRMI